MLLVSGAMDPFVSEPASARLAEALRSAGAMLEHRVLPAGHAMTEQDLALAKAFLA